MSAFHFIATELLPCFAACHDMPRHATNHILAIQNVTRIQWQHFVVPNLPSWTTPIFDCG